MTNIYLRDSDEEAIEDFVKDHKELYDKTNEHFKDKAKKECLWESFTNSHKLSVKVCKTWFELQRPHYGKLMQLICPLCIRLKHLIATLQNSGSFFS